MRTRKSDFKGTGNSSGFSYVIKHAKADGTKETTYCGGGEKAVVTEKLDGSAPTVIVKDSKGKRKVAYNMSHLFGQKPDKRRREDDINRGLNRYRKEYRSTGGMNKTKTMKHVASIPPELWYSEQAENGGESLRDPKHLKKFISEWGFGVSGGKR